MRLKGREGEGREREILIRPMVDVSDSETRKCRVHVSECVTRK